MEKDMSELFQIIFSGVVALSTIVYAILTWRLVSETRRMRQLQITPDVHCYFEMSEASATIVYIIFENIGYGIAKDIEFNLVKDFKYYDLKEQRLDSKGAIKNGLKNFYPKQKLKFFFTDLSKKNAEKIEEEIEIKLNYKDINNNNISKTLNLRLDEVTGTGKFVPPDTYMGRVAHELKEIKKVIENKE